MKLKALTMLIAVGILAGCATGPKNVQGTGAFYTLSDRNVIERDLTRPIGPNNQPFYPDYQDFPGAL
jgi:starvation-inducible outer membrane lipoprotein